MEETWNTDGAIIYNSETKKTYDLHSALVELLDRVE